MSFGRVGWRWMELGGEVRLTFFFKTMSAKFALYPSAITLSLSRSLYPSLAPASLAKLDADACLILIYCYCCRGLVLLPLLAISQS